nr:hypothetical protein [Tanacetum cinerariifolium]
MYGGVWLGSANVSAMYYPRSEKTTNGTRRVIRTGPIKLCFNSQREAVEVIGAFYLCLPSGLEIVLNNCHYAPSITRGVIFVFRLYEDGFVNHFVDNTIQVSRNNVVYFSAVPRDGIFEIDLSNSLTNESYIYAVSNNRAKLDLDSALLWAFEKCLSCMSGKMERKPYTHQVERAKDVLGLIHTDHKHEVFETFKVFQKEVENQLGKAIKSLRSDREGEYMSQEFLDHLKDHGIIAHRTPPYTPQHNGVSERRNRTLLDMVRSMMSQTTLPTSFWDYSLETAARIFNMVPTKKETMGYSFYYPPENKVLVAQNAEFLENSLIDQERYCMKNSKRESIPMQEKLKLSKSQGASTPAELKRMQNVPYASAVGSIMYAVRCTRPDVEFAQNKSVKQSIFATSSVEAEYIAAFYASKEAVWVRKFISGLGVVPTIKEPICMYCDNTGAIAIANESGITKGARHFRAKVHYLREVIEFGDIKLEKVHTNDNLADHFTKALAFPKHSEHTRNIRMLPASSLM